MCMCFCFFLLGFSFCFSGGFLMFTLMDDWSVSWNLFLICFLQVIVVSWIYGIDTLLVNVDQMGIKLQKSTKIYFKICLAYITPAMLFVLFITSLVQSEPSKVENYVFEESGVQAMAWLMGIFSISFIPIIACCILHAMCYMTYFPFQNPGFKHCVL